ncbi:alpha/beta fold hydrolase [Trinickia dinghuensis]|uniref:Alpha/beta fold hydrolase n=1 Tax=Trinickia dinghuensis TaxID=2291023 RepID=A0A3D8JVQ7_9BURK|nr:alpha/beta fold hydrolase [Trinickia dinghuensis]RDU96872.1 alpha/beta fold hydrolase [Trinickia dinghuensis]
MNIESNGVRIHVRNTGDGNAALVFLHYWGGSSRTWRHVIDALPDRHRTVAYDHRGWGESEAPVDGYAIGDLADDAQNVIASLGLEHYVIVGHSMGGKVAQCIAARGPQGLAGVVLVAPSPPEPMALTDEQRAQMAGAYDSRESIEFVIDHVLTAQPLPAEMREQVVADSLRGAPQAKAAWPNAAMREDISTVVKAIDVPVLVISGEHDRVDSPDTLRKALLPHIAQAHMEVLPGIGHLSPLEAPAALASLIEAFVEKIDAGETTPASVPKAFDAALNAGDLERVLSLFTDDATMRMTDGEVVAANRDALRERFRGLLSMKPHIRNIVRRTIASGDIALVLMDWSLTLTLPDGGQATETGTATQVMQRQESGAWRLRISNPLGVA